MKLVTINTHSLIEENYSQKLEYFIDFICRETPDLITMQEVNQSTFSPIYKPPLSGFSPISDKLSPIREDNHALQAALRLFAKGICYYWTWLPVKLGYGKYDEGMAIFSKEPITDIDHFYISVFEDYHYWKTRQVLGIKTANLEDWFYTVHMGWWDDIEDPFKNQWKRFLEHLQETSPSSKIWLLGDFNSPAEVRNEGYDLIEASGFFDTYQLACQKDEGITVKGVIDGWRDKLDTPDAFEGMRIDHIWCNQKTAVLTSTVIFNETKEPVISDHFGIMIETKD